MRMVKIYLTRLDCSNKALYLKKYYCQMRMYANITWRCQLLEF
ncbi:MAG: hypothetical protein UU05_C0006G0017, partial [Candidatus Curtissbacteria bacterium GW2011_GWA1_40_47]